MTALSAILPSDPSARSLRIASRYMLSTGGPLSISAAHFLASILILHALPAKDFGIFSFALIVVPLCLSATGALLNASLTRAMADTQATRETELLAHMKANLLFCASAAFLSGILAFGSGASAAVAALLGLYGSTMCLRWFARAVRYIANDPSRVALSDLCYSLSLVCGLSYLWAVQSLTIAHVAFVMAASAMIATACFGVSHLKRQFVSSLKAPLQNYLATWRALTRWSFLGVLLTEATANAHAYLVTFISGSQSFALLAIGALFMRPVSLSLAALSDAERPFMAKSIASGAMEKAERCVREFRAAGVATWITTMLLCVAVLIWLPGLILKQEYHLGDVAIVVTLWAAIMVVRIVRTPDLVLLQAAGEFQTLASAAYLSSVVSIGLTLLLLLIFGPVASLLGILVGDAVMTAQILSAVRKWKHANG